MKKIILTAMFLAFGAPLFAQHRAHTTSGILGMEIVEFAREGSQLAVEMNMRLSGAAVSPTDRWEITPVLVSGKHRKELPQIVVNGNNRRNLVHRANVVGHSAQRYGAAGAVLTENVRRKDNRTAAYKAKLPYEDWMSAATLKLETRLVSCSCVHEFSEELSSMRASEPYVVKAEVISISPKQEAVKMRDISATAFVDYIVGQTAVVPGFRSNMDELDKIKATLDQVKGNKDMTFRNISLIGYASPEGSYPNNERLASSRVNSLKSYIASNFGVPAGDIRTSHVAEDWKGLRAMVEKSTVESAGEILAIIDGSDAPDTKEARLKALAGGRPWSVMLSEMMPPLRRTDYRVDFTVRDYTVQDSRAVLQSNPKLLSHYELDALARELDPASAEYARIYELIEAQNTNDDVANINVAAFRIARGDIPAARRALERVKEKRPEYHNNYGVVLLHEGKYNEALESLRLAGSSPEAAHNIQEINKFIASNR